MRRSACVVVDGIRSDHAPMPIIHLLDTVMSNEHENVRMHAFVCYGPNMLAFVCYDPNTIVGSIDTVRYINSTAVCSYTYMY